MHPIAGHWCSSWTYSKKRSQPRCLCLAAVRDACFQPFAAHVQRRCARGAIYGGLKGDMFWDSQTTTSIISLLLARMDVARLQASRPNAALFASFPDARRRPRPTSRFSPRPRRAYITPPLVQNGTLVFDLSFVQRCLRLYASSLPLHWCLCWHVPQTQ